MNDEWWMMNDEWWMMNDDDYKAWATNVYALNVFINVLMFLYESTPYAKWRYYKMFKGI